MKSQNKKNLYAIFVNAIIRKEFTKDEVNDILSELHIDEITWERIRKTINKKKEKEEKKGKLEEERIKEEREKKEKEEIEKRKEHWEFYQHPSAPP